MLWVPLVAFVMAAGNVDLLIAAAIVMAWRGHGAPLAIFGLAKIAPFLGLPIPWQRQVFVTLLIAFLITLPWLGLWVEWIEFLLRQPTMIRISLPLGPWWLRLPIALALLIPRRSYLSGPCRRGGDAVAVPLHLDDPDRAALPLPPGAPRPRRQTGWRKPAR